VRQDEGVPTHVALLRGINVGGRNKVAMADLRELVAGLGHADVATYIQSGNVVFSTTRSDDAALAGELEQAIAAGLGVSPRVIVLSREELSQVQRDNPYKGEPNPRAVHAIFLNDMPGPEVAAAVTQAVREVGQRGSRDTAQVIGRTIFLHTPDSFGRSDLAVLLTRRSPPGGSGLTSTARNVATVTKLLALCGDAG
jgi:uncharacterized protein (DUF1697 family)